MATGRIGVTPTLRTRWSEQPTAGTTVLSGLDDNSVALVYDAGYEAVYRNGVLLSRGNDYTATDGTTITLIDATLAGDIIEVFANDLVPLTDAISKAQFTAKGALLSASAASTPGVVTVGANGTVLTADSAEATGVKWALPASGVITWTNRLNITDAARSFNQIAYNGTNLYVAVGSNGVMYTSSDGETWTSRTSGFGSNNINDVFYGNGLWVAVGSNGTITTSSDGETWTARTANMSTNSINAVIYANSLWVAVGAGGGTTNTGGITYSSDGTTWTRKSQSINVGPTYTSVAYNGTNWVVASNHNGTGNYLYASTPSNTWTGATTSATGTMNGLIWDGTRHIWNEATNDLYFSTSTTLATQTGYVGLPNGAFNIRTLKLYSGNVYLQGGGWIQSFVPASTAWGSVLSTPIITPAVRINGSAALEDNENCLSVFANGYIIGTSTGEIYTSF